MPVPAPAIELQVGEPVDHRGVTVTPLFPRQIPRAVYITLDEAVGLGLRVAEVEPAGRVPELRVTNPTDHRVLLCDGEELAGAKQDRIPEVSVLLEAGADLTIPVSCVEQGRWHRTSADMAPARHTAHPALRHRKAETLAGRHAGTTRTTQREVWAEVAAKASRLGSLSATGASAGTFRARAGEIRELAGHFPPQPGQCGAVLSLGGAPVCLDAVSRPEAYARLHDKLMAGYMLDALEALDGPPTPSTVVGWFVGTACAATPSARPAVGLGETLVIRTATLTGTGLSLDGEVLQLSVYPRR